MINEQWEIGKRERKRENELQGDGRIRETKIQKRREREREIDSRSRGCDSCKFVFHKSHSYHSLVVARSARSHTRPLYKRRDSPSRTKPVLSSNDTERFSSVAPRECKRTGDDLRGLSRARSGVNSGWYRSKIVWEGESSWTNQSNRPPPDYPRLLMVVRAKQIYGAPDLLDFQRVVHHHVHSPRSRILAVFSESRR